MPRQEPTSLVVDLQQYSSIQSKHYDKVSKGTDIKRAEENQVDYVQVALLALLRVTELLDKLLEVGNIDVVIYQEKRNFVEEIENLILITNLLIRFLNKQVPTDTYGYINEDRLKELLA